MRKKRVITGRIKERQINAVKKKLEIIKERKKTIDRMKGISIKKKRKKRKEEGKIQGKKAVEINKEQKKEPKKKK